MPEHPVRAGTVAPVTHSLATTTTLALGPSWLDPEQILTMLGPYVLVGVCFIVFAECGLLLGFFLPGDSLLFTAGLFAASGLMGAHIAVVCLLLTACAVLGNVTGYYIGYKAGPALFNKPDSKLFKREYVDKTHGFFERYGPRAIVLGRFVPIVRTFITAIAGVGRMDPRVYFTYSVLGGILWATGITLLGYFLGQIEFVRANVEAMILLIVFVSIIPIIVEVVRTRRQNRRAATSS